MRPTFAALALSLALPAAAHAQSAAGDKPKMECCCKDKPMACCPDHGKADKPAKDAHEGHEGHDAARPNS